MFFSWLFSIDALIIRKNIHNVYLCTFQKPFALINWNSEHFSWAISNRRSSQTKECIEKNTLGFTFLNIFQMTNMTMMQWFALHYGISCYQEVQGRGVVYVFQYTQVQTIFFHFPRCMIPYNYKILSKYHTNSCLFKSMF